VVARGGDSCRRGALHPKRVRHHSLALRESPPVVTRKNGRGVEGHAGMGRASEGERPIAYPTATVSMEGRSVRCVFLLRHEAGIKPGRPFFVATQMSTKRSDHDRDRSERGGETGRSQRTDDQQLAPAGLAEESTEHLRLPRVRSRERDGGSEAEGRGGERDQQASEASAREVRKFLEPLTLGVYLVSYRMSRAFHRVK
jgi:hypothetical protein